MNSYKQLQSANSEKLSSLTKAARREAIGKLKNCGWANVTAIHNILFSTNYETPKRTKGAQQYQGMGYYELQAYLKDEFDKLNKEQQGALKAGGFKRIGWDNLKKSYGLLQEVNSTNKVVELKVVEPSPTNNSSNQSADVIPFKRDSAYYDRIADRMIDSDEDCDMEKLQEILNKSSKLAKEENQAEFERRMAKHKADTEQGEAKFNAHINKLKNILGVS